MIAVVDLDLQESEHFLFFSIYLSRDMSKNHDRYNEDYSHLDIEKPERRNTYDTIDQPITF
jgi:hypothetical protein